MKLTLPNINSAVLNKEFRLIPPWLQFFAGLVSDPSAIEPVVIGGSPFEYSGREKGTLSIIGGTVSSITITRAGLTIPTGATSGLVPVGSGDQIIITYTVAPTVNFIPG